MDILKITYFGRFFKKTRSLKEVLWVILSREEAGMLSF